ncbi:20103_t:CDS:2 [Funneliformis geosporum]|uniref:12139_t:CDS:1 n=1 Tax=Funneliformis geosporum TaxID=1117311 RepID=A0A9W4SNV1_9GLOM|nr:20103_t:CDS:2 [Funneliformis geosporum]CAI2175088.1 12139_t:CDS:2 [Funneliformis geosporum]
MPPNRELKALLASMNTFPTLTSVEGNNIAERLKKRQRRKPISRIEAKRIELENPFIARRTTKRKRNEFIESESAWEPWEEVTPTRQLRRSRTVIMRNAYIRPRVETSTREKRRRLQTSEEMQEDKKELDAVESLLAMANGSKASQMMMTSKRVMGEINMRSPKPVLRELFPQVKSEPKKVYYVLKRKEIKSLLTSWNAHRRGMFVLLADHIVSATKRREKNGDSLDFRTLLEQCLENYICHDEKTFRHYLEDFYYHGLFFAIKTPCGEIRITIPTPLHDLKLLLSDKNLFGDLD